MINLEFIDNIGKVNIHILGNGYLDGEILDEVYLAYAVIETITSKFYAKVHISNDGKFILLFERIEWIKYEKQFNLISQDGVITKALSMKSLIAQSNKNILQMGIYNLTDGNNTIQIGILGEKLPDINERRIIARDWSIAVEYILSKGI